MISRKSLLCVTLALPLAACGGDDNKNDRPDAGDPPGDVVEVTAAIEASASWTADKTYVLKDHIFIRDATLTIEAGTTIKGGANTSIVVTKSGRIDAQGTASAPIVFTSDQPVGARAAGDWGGVVLLGAAPINVEGGTDNVEGFPASVGGTDYGGADPAHDCGTIKYARIEFAGFQLAPDNELNGLTVAGCGSGTTLDYIQVHKGADDGIEFFGGTASLTHAVITQVDDDGLDWDYGWTGKVQWLIVQQNATVGNYGVESDNNGNNNDATPRSAPTLWNVTLIGSNAGVGEAGKAQGGMLLRRGTAGLVSNAIIAYFADFAVDIADHATVQQAGAGALGIRYSYFYRNGGDGDGWPEGFDVANGMENDCQTPGQGCVGFDEAAFFTDEGNSNVWADPMLSDPLNLTAPSFAPAAGSPVLEAGATPGEGFDSAATYAGAIGAVDWTAGWTAFPAD